MMRTRFEASIEKKQAVKVAEKNNQIADSHEVRLELMKRVHSGEITLQEAQKQLKNIQNSARMNGMKTRSQVFNEG
jgi:uncharacterized membrane protein YjjP (DUF1212 family)